MRLPTYLYRRPDTGSILFRWGIPAFLRPALGGRREIRRTVPLRDKREALRVARHLSVALDRGVALMAKQRPSGSGYVMHCLLRYIEQIAADGTVTRTHEVQIDPDKLEALGQAFTVAAHCGPTRSA